jgi:hypothetical protein
VSEGFTNGATTPAFERQAGFPGKFRDCAQTEPYFSTVAFQILQRNLQNARKCERVLAFRISIQIHSQFANRDRPARWDDAK